MAKSERAFSLMEVVIVMVLIAIVATISIPAYQRHVVTTHRADGQLALLKLSSALENYYLSHHTYHGADFSVLEQAPVSPEGFYRLAIVLKNDGQSYEIQAIPVGQQAAADKACGTLQLSTDGRRTFLGTDANAVCW